MNLIEAHKSGRRWRREAWRGVPDNTWFKCLADKDTGQSVSIIACVETAYDYQDCLPLDAEDITAEDYTLEPEAKLLTRNEVRDTIAAYLDYTHGDKMLNKALDRLFKEST